LFRRLRSGLLATASRDGTARVWDRRISGYAGVLPGEGQAVGMVNQIKNAHVPAKSKTGKGVRLLLQTFLAGHH
jgi:hypothetical protein